MKLEVGMYVRHKPLLSSKYVKINKIKEIEEKENCLHIWLEDKDLITEKYLIKASYNIIDILEVGDIIKLFMEDDIDGEDTNIFELIAINYNDNEIGVFNSDFQIEFFPIENLRGILTHEQMEQMAYKVGD